MRKEGGKEMGKRDRRRRRKKNKTRPSFGIRMRKQIRMISNLHIKILIISNDTKLIRLNQIDMMTNRKK